MLTGVISLFENIDRVEQKCFDKSIENQILLLTTGYSFCVYKIRVFELLQREASFHLGKCRGDTRYTSDICLIQN